MGLCKLQKKGKNGEEKKVCWKFAFVVCISLSSLSHSFHINCGALSGRALGKRYLWGHRWDRIFLSRTLGPFSGKYWDVFQGTGASVSMLGISESWHRRNFFSNIKTTLSDSEGHLSPSFYHWGNKTA